MFSKCNGNIIFFFQIRFPAPLCNCNYPTKVFILEYLANLVLKTLIQIIASESA